MKDTQNIERTHTEVTIVNFFVINLRREDNLQRHNVWTLCRGSTIFTSVKCA